MLNVSRFAGLALAATLASFGAVGVAHAGVTGDKTCGGAQSCVSGHNTGSGNGVLGVNSGTGYGVQGQSAGTNAAVGGFNSSNGSGIFGSSSSGSGINGSSTNGFGSQAYSANNVATYAYSANGNGADIYGSYIGVIARSSTYPFVATDANGNDLFFIDVSGNVYYHGTLNTFLRTGRGGVATAYGSKSTSPTVEDVGSARLQSGAVTVALDPAFAQSIDGRDNYHVFVTPNGDTRGLYVASKSATSFTVREAQQGRSTLDFDYRIVATAVGHAGERSRIVDPASVSHPRAMPVARPATR